MHTRLLPFKICFLLLFFSFPQKSCFPADKPVVYFGIGLRYHPITLYELYQPMMDYLTRNTPYRFELKISKNYKDILTDLDTGKTSASFVGDGGLMKAMVLHGAIPIVKPLNAEGKPSYRSCIIVLANSGIKSLTDLKNKKIAFGSRHSTTGNLIPRYMLKNSGVAIEDLGSLDNLRNHDAVARAVAKGEYDAGAIKSTAAERYKNRGVRVIATSEEIPSIALIVKKDTPKELIRAITDALVRLDRRNPEHRKIMENWDAEYKYGFVPASATDYQGLIRMFKAKPLGCTSGCHR